MTEVSFYHLTKTPLEKALPQLLEKVVAGDKRAVVMVADEAKLKEVDRFLWTYKTESFLPHGTKKDGNSDKQPIYITTEEENPNSASFLVALDGIEPKFIADFERCLDIFDGHADNDVEEARNRWKSYKDKENLALTYWKQGDNGGWQKSG